MCEKYLNKNNNLIKLKTFNACFRYFLIFPAKKTILQRPLTLIYNYNMLTKTIYYE